MPTQNSDVNGNPFGIEYTAPGQKWKILEGVDVTGTDVGVYSEYVNSKLVNKGSVFGGDVGVYFDGNGLAGSYVIKNKDGGEIRGQYGVVVESFTGSLLMKNDGKTIGSTYGAFIEGSSNVEIENKGKMSGAEAALVLYPNQPGGQGPMIDNYGEITSSNLGIVIENDFGYQARITNYEGGKIQGATAAIYSEEKLKLKNEGKIKGSVYTDDYDDKVVNKHKVKGDAWLGEGNDVYKNKGDAKTKGLIDSREGNDKLVLGNKTDKLLFDTALNATTNVDRIKKFESKDDKMYLDEDIFTSLTPGQLSSSEFHKGSAAQDANDYIIYNKSAGALYYDQDGVGGANQVQFAQLDPNTKLKASDFLVGEYSLNI